MSDTNGSTPNETPNETTNETPTTNDTPTNEQTQPSSWDEVGSRLGALGLKLKYHAEQAAGEERTTFTSALDSLSASIDHAFEALKAAAKDEALKDDVKSVAAALSGAVSETLTGVGQGVRKVLKHD